MINIIYMQIYRIGEIKMKNPILIQVAMEIECQEILKQIDNLEILTLKGFEKYLDLPFEQTAKLVGYSDVTIEYGEENIIVSYEKYDKMREQYKT